VGTTFHLAGAKWQKRLRTVESLDLGFLVHAKHHRSIRSFTPQQNVLGAALETNSVQRVTFRESRPYGEATEPQTVWLARYEAVPINADNGRHSASVPLSLVFDASSSALLCAFTDPAPTWARST
jgi:hypothetical protein